MKQDLCAEPEQRSVMLQKVQGCVTGDGKRRGKQRQTRREAARLPQSEPVELGLCR